MLWALRDRIERLVEQRREVRLRWETAVVVLEALRAYVAHPTRARIASILCIRTHVRNAPCDPLCRRCLETAHELKCLFRGVPDWFGEQEVGDCSERGRHRR